MDCCFWSTISLSLKNSRFGVIEEGCTPLQLLWKDPQTAKYCVNTDAHGNVMDMQSVTVRDVSSDETSYFTETMHFSPWKDLLLLKQIFLTMRMTHCCDVQ